MACADQLLDLDDSVGKWPSDRPHGLTIRCGYCTPLPTPDNEGSCMVFWASQSHVTSQIHGCGCFVASTLPRQ